MRECQQEQLRRALIRRLFTITIRGPRIQPRAKGWWYAYRHLWKRANVERCPVCDKE